MVEVKDLVKELADKHGRKQESLIPILQDVVQEKKFLTDEAMTEIASELDMSAALVYGTATFYSFLDVEPCGEYVIRVCKTITCDMKGKREVIQAIEDVLKIKVGDTTPNNKFTLKETNCLGWCHKGPAMLINDEVYTELTPEKVTDILKDYLRNK